jgi:hypothetical protein
MTARMSGRALSVALLSAAVALGGTACGGGGSDSRESQPPKQEAEAPAPEEHTPESCLGDVGVDTMRQAGPKIWSGVHKSGYLIRIRHFNSPAAAHRAVEGASGLVAYQANFYAVFGPIVAQDDGSTKAVARCLRGTL